MNSSSEPTPITNNAMEPIEAIGMIEGSNACDGLSDFSEGETWPCADGGKHEHIHPNVYECGTELHHGITNYIDYYNQVRKHSSLDNRTPAEVYYKNVA